jgi:hypothetical protein
MCLFVSMHVCVFGCDLWRGPCSDPAGFGFASLCSLSPGLASFGFASLCSLSSGLESFQALLSHLQLLLMLVLLLIKKKCVFACGGVCALLRLLICASAGKLGRYVGR